jgi:predicted DCC family thiol-disulfide oxidoreductase YuxK
MTKLYGPTNEAGTLTVYYNGACPVCDHEIRHYIRLAEKAGAPIAWVDIAGEAGAVCPMDRVEAMKRLHGVDAGGRTLVGVDCFEAIWALLPGWRLLARAMAFGPVRALIHVGYERVAVPLLWAWNKKRLARKGLISGG